LTALGAHAASFAAARRCLRFLVIIMINIIIDIIIIILYTKTNASQEIPCIA